MTFRINRKRGCSIDEPAKNHTYWDYEGVFKKKDSQFFDKLNFFKITIDDKVEMVHGSSLLMLTK